MHYSTRADYINSTPVYSRLRKSWELEQVSAYGTRDEAHHFGSKWTASTWIVYFDAQSTSLIWKSRGSSSCWTRLVGLSIQTESSTLHGDQRFFTIFSIGSYLESPESIQHPCTCSFKITFNIILPSTPTSVNKVVSFFHVFRLKSCRPLYVSSP